MKRAPPTVDERAGVLERIRNEKMARSPHAFVRGNTVQFYERLPSLATDRLPHGPPIWICGDCHVGNLGPVADAAGLVRVQVRDLDLTVIGNPAHDLIRLALSLASAARGSSLPGVTTVRMLEAIMSGYETAFDHDFDATVEVVDAAYWMKGCGTLGRLRFAVLLGVTDEPSGDTDLCLMDIKEAVGSPAPAHPGAPEPADDAQRLVEGARHLSPFLGERMRATRLGGRPVFIRELLPQDLKVEIDHLTTEEAMKAARFQPRAELPRALSTPRNGHRRNPPVTDPTPSG